MAVRDRRVVMARVGAPHGVRGAVRLTVFAEEPLALRRYNPFETAGGASLRVKRVKLVGKAIVAEIDGVDDRSAAEALRGEELGVPRNRLPRPADDEFYHVDLIGLEARLPSGELLGEVRAVSDFGAGDILEIGGRKPLAVPFTREAVPTIDFGAGTLTVDPPPGLLNEDDDKAEEGP